VNVVAVRIARMEPAEIIVHLESNCAWLASQVAASDG
jgi:hypothetical protein